MKPDFSRIDRILERSAEKDRFELYEHEVYEVLAAAGIGHPPAHAVIRSPNEVDQLPKGDSLVVKIAEPRVAHKTEIGGVAIVSRADLAKTVKRMFKGDVKSLLISEFIELPEGFGHELFLGMREAEEFGPVINVGLGGIDTELYAREFKRGRAGMTFAPDLSKMESLPQILPWQTLTGKARGHKEIISVKSCQELIRRFEALVRHYSPLNSKAPFWFSEFEVNPFRFRKREPIPVDGLLRFRSPETMEAQPPVEKLENLFHPKHACIVGVSSKGMNFGRIILQNLLQGSFQPDSLAVIQKEGASIDGVQGYRSISELPRKYDLFVVATAVEQASFVVNDLITHNKAESIVLVTGGMGEKRGGEAIEEKLRTSLVSSKTRPVMVGGNSLGIISRPGGYDTLFVPESKVPRNPTHPLGKNTAVISQSGAFVITRMTKMGDFVPHYFVSTGNEIDLSVSDFVRYLSDRDEVDVIGCYVEGFRPYRGRRFAHAARKAVEQGKDVLVYKVGRSQKGRDAASGHTATVAGDWDVAESVLSSVGCRVAESFEEWSDFLMLSSLLKKFNIQGGRLGAISNAGYETVGIADHHEGLELAEYREATKKKIGAILKEHRLSQLQDIRNPIDLTPMASDRAHVEILEALATDPGIDLLLHACVPLTAAISDNFPKELISAVERIAKPVVSVIDAGSLYDSLAREILEAGIPIFRSADRAARTLGRWIRV